MFTNVSITSSPSTPPSPSPALTVQSDGVGTVPCDSVGTQLVSASDEVDIVVDEGQQEQGDEQVS